MKEIRNWTTKKKPQKWHKRMANGSLRSWISQKTEKIVKLCQMEFSKSWESRLFNAFPVESQRIDFLSWVSLLAIKCEISRCVWHSQFIKIQSSSSFSRSTRTRHIRVVCDTKREIKTLSEFYFFHCHTSNGRSLKYAEFLFTCKNRQICQLVVGVVIKKNSERKKMGQFRWVNEFVNWMLNKFHVIVRLWSHKWWYRIWVHLGKFTQLF